MEAVEPKFFLTLLLSYRVANASRQLLKTFSVVPFWINKYDLKSLIWEALLGKKLKMSSIGKVLLIKESRNNKNNQIESFEFWVRDVFFFDLREILNDKKVMFNILYYHMISYFSAYTTNWSHSWSYRGLDRRSLGRE